MKNAFAAISLVTLLSACASQDYYQRQEAHQQDSVVALERIQVSQDQLSNQCSQISVQSLAQFEAIKNQLDAIAEINQRTLTEAKKELIIPAPINNCPDSSSPSKMVLGETEWVSIPSISETFIARIDTGATTSSLNAKDIERFEREGKQWVRFNLAHMDSDAQAEFELPIKRNVNIVQSSNDEGERRPVVELLIQIGDAHELTEFTLADRSHLNFPILIGRNFLRDIAIVDVSLKNTIAKP